MKKEKNKRINCLFVCMLVLFLLVLSGCSKKEEVKPQDDVPVETDDNQKQEQQEEEKQEEVVVNIKEKADIMNPLTGLEIKQSAVGVRPVAIMVENSEPARPQWGMDDKEYSPDIILEAEIEYGITRTMWLFADYTSLPDTIGPVRSARPPFVMFSQLFDSIYVHWGQSETLWPYIGANDVIAMNNVNNINQMAYRGRTNIFARSQERAVDLEHTGILYGKKLADAISEYGYRTKIDDKKFSTLDFNDKSTPLSDTTCNKIKILVSRLSWNKTWTFDETDNMYHTNDFKNKLTRDNILVLYDQTEYITKPAASFSYCDYSFTSGEGKLASLGTVMDIKWSVEKGKLIIQDLKGNPVKLNPGKTWIGWISSNNGGKITVE